jgi:AsmA-like protein
MSVWKSPIIYVGIALVLFIVALLSAPFIIDWNSYRASIEDYGRKLTGRDVTVSGDISARVFPWPRLRLEGVRIANPEGAATPDLVRARAIEARMLLGSLLSGYVEVSDIRIENPVFALERLETGEASWWLAPELKGGVPMGAERISVENLEIVDGQVLLSDSRRGGTAKFEDFDAILSSQTLLGPWKARGELKHRGQRLSLGVSTGKQRPGEPFKFGIKLGPVAGPGLVYAFDGEYASRGDTPVRGILRIDPMMDVAGNKTEASAPPLTFKAKLSFKEDHALLQEIEIASTDRDQPGNLLTGSAAIELQSRISILANLKAPKFDLDEMLGEEGRQLVKDGAILEDLVQFLEILPEGLDGHLILDVGTLIAGTEKLDGAKLEAELADRGLVVHELSANLPGQTKAKFSGLLFANGDRPQLSGDVQIESAGTRDFLVWLMPEWQKAIAAHWTGARGKLSLRSKLDYASQSLRLGEARFSLDESTGSGELALAAEPSGGNSIRVKLDRLDLDRYLPDGLGPLSLPPELLAGIGAMGQGANALGDVQLLLEAGKLTINGIEADAVKADVTATPDVLDVHAIEIGRVGQARLELSGALESANGSNAGSATLKIEAADPQLLLRMLGLIPQPKVGMPDPPWTVALAPLYASLTTSLERKENESQLNLNLEGSAGQSKLSLNSVFTGDLADLKSGRLQLSGNLESPSAQKLLSLFGRSLKATDTQPARLAMSVDGEVSTGLLIQSELQLLGAEAGFSGTVEDLIAGGSPELAGTLTLDAPNAGPLIEALGIAKPEPGVPLKLTSRLQGRLGSIDLNDFKGALGEQQFDGRLSIENGLLNVVMHAAELSAPALLSIALMPMDGRSLEPVTLFATSPLGGAEGRILLETDRMAMFSGFGLVKARTELNSVDGRLSLSIDGTGPQGTPFVLKANTSREADELRLEAALEGALEMSEVLSAPDGEPVIDSLLSIKASLTGKGRSPAGLASSMTGQGTVSMPKGFVRGIDADSFISGLRFSPTSGAVDRLLRQGFTGSDLIFTGGAGTLAVAEGVATLGPVAFEAGGIQGSIKTIFEALSRKVDVSVEIGLKALGDVPPVEVSYAGPARALERNVDASELRARLSAVELKQNMDKLEKLQREQLELFAEEERQAKVQAAERAAAERRRTQWLAARERAEGQAALDRTAAEEQASAEALRLDLEELKRRAGVLEQNRRTVQKERSLEEVADRRELQRQSAAAERFRQPERAALARAVEARRQADALERERQRLAAEAARRVEEERLAREAAQKAEEERKAREAAMELERQRLAAEAERRRQAEEAERQRLAEEVERQRLAEEAERQRLAEEAERQRLAEEAARQAEAERLAREAAQRAEEERKAREAAMELERQRLAAEAARRAEEERLAREAARKAEEERKAREMAIELERKRLAEEALRKQRQAEEDAKAREAALLLEQEIKRKADEEKKAREAALVLERQRQAEEAARRAEEERKAREAALESERRRQAEEAEQRRLAEEAVRAEQERKRLLAALEIERQRLAEEAERNRQEELERARLQAFEKMNEREMIQHLQRTGAWASTYRRAKETAAQRALEEAKAKIDQLLKEAGQPSTESLAPKQKQPASSADDLPSATQSIAPSAVEQTREDLEAEPLPVDDSDEASRGPKLIDPSSAAASVGPDQSAIDSAETVEGDRTRVRRNGQFEANWLERLERMIKLPPGSAKKDINPRKRYNFNR